MSRGVLIIPAFNEERALPRVLPEIAAADLGLELVVVDDGSHDDTARVAAAHGATVVRHPFNLGYGAALQTGYKYARQRNAPLLAQMDADGQHVAGEVRTLIEPILAGECDLVLGSRFLEPSGYRMTPLQTLGRHAFRLLARSLGLRLSDPTSGFQAMNARVLEVYTRDFFPTDFPDVDVLLTAHRHRLRVGERPVKMRKALRGSSLHGGLRDFYYVYKMLLSIWSAPRLQIGSRGAGGDP